MLRRLLVLAVVVGVVLSQQSFQRSQNLRPGPGSGQLVKRIVRPRPQQNAGIALLPNPLSQGPRPRPSPAASIPIDPPSFRAPPPGFSQTAINRPAAPAPRPQQPRPQPPRRPAQQSHAADVNFAVDDNQRGRKEPNVKILRSWSHHNADGTFSWGYINDDGSFKNETRGHDCIVRGVYGYVDIETGEQLSFPYETGIACDPDAPDYYYDYDNNAVVFDDAGQILSRSGSGPLSRQG